MHRLGSRPNIFWWTAVSAALMIVGGFGPWATALGVATVAGTDGGDGWFLVVGGLLAGSLLFRQASRPGSRWPAILVVLCGLIGALVALVDLADINSLSGESGIFGDVIDVGWGLYLSVVASVSLTLAAIATLVRRPYARVPVVAADA